MNRRNSLVRVMPPYQLAAITPHSFPTFQTSVPNQSSVHMNRKKKLLIGFLVCFTLAVIILIILIVILSKESSGKSLIGSGWEGLDHPMGFLICFTNHHIMSKQFLAPWGSSAECVQVSIT